MFGIRVYAVSDINTYPEHTPTTHGSRRQEKALGQQIEPGSAIHLALQHLQAVDVPFDGSLTPGQRYRRLNGGHIRSEPFGEASDGSSPPHFRGSL